MSSSLFLHSFSRCVGRRDKKAEVRWDGTPDVFDAELLVRQGNGTTALTTPQKRVFFLILFFGKWTTTPFCRKQFVSTADDMQSH
eukprot:scaffold2678_cov236-Ochromonas_danica.AAC.2